MTSVFLLWRSREISPGESDDKLIGVYSSRAESEAARFRAAQREGFKDVPEEFEISEYELNKDHWTEGYVTV